ncbi:hypothetical protein [Hymenobacter gummosus]|uniref:hypothetical protein n=1 Tax=Hymenobacter gummosus TaxID=1776032 RepID=UPI001FB27BB8|nr:hypothetical protein [Hymenobacter gummosus]
MFYNLTAHPGLTQDQHRALPHVSNTDLSDLKAQALGQLRAPNPAALAYGTAFHAATLEPATYARTPTSARGSSWSSWPATCAANATAATCFTAELQNSRTRPPTPPPACK